MTTPPTAKQSPPDTAAHSPADVAYLRERLAVLESENRELRETYRAMQSMRDFYQDLYQSAPAGCIDFDHRGCIWQLNRTAAQLLGKPPSELIGHAFLAYLGSRDVQKFLAHLRQCLHTPGRHTIELRLRIGEGPLLTLQLWSHAVRPASHHEPVCRTTLTDITDRKQAEEALHESKECFRVMTDNAPVLIWMTNEDGYCTYFNKAWMEYTGRPLNQELGNGWRAGIHPEDRPRSMDLFDLAFQDKERFSFEFRLSNAEGNYRWFLNTGVPRLTPQQDFAGFIGSCIDITERKEAEELRRQILEDLEILVQERTANLKSANSKLQNEVTARKRLEKQIVEIADREQRRIGNDLHDGLGQQLTGVSFLSKLLEQKLTARKAPEAKDAVQIYQLVSNALSHTRELARGLHVVELDAGGVPSALQDLRGQTESLFNVQCELKCDSSIGFDDPASATHVFRITQEAVNNAIKHGKAKRIEICLSKSDRKAHLTVTDNGAGCLPSQGKKGIGLHTMKYRSEMLGGTFEIQRRPKGGTVVTCSFPIKSRRKQKKDKPVTSH